MPGGQTHSPCILSRNRQRVLQLGSFEEMQLMLRSAENKTQQVNHLISEPSRLGSLKLLGKEDISFRIREEIRYQRIYLTPLSL